MRAFQRHRDGAFCFFEDSEVELLKSLLSQLIELVNDECANQARFGAQLDESIFDTLERELAASAPEPVEHNDPVLARLFPKAYPNDNQAEVDFRRFTAQALYDEKLAAARVMLADLLLIAPGSECEVCAVHVASWLKALTSLRLALAVRLNIKNAEDLDELADLSQDDPRSWILAVYEWLGWVQESLLAAVE